MEVYSLLDTDLPGEEGNEVEIDDTVGEVLTLNFEGTLQKACCKNYVLCTQKTDIFDLVSVTSPQVVSTRE